MPLGKVHKKTSICEFCFWKYKCYVLTFNYFCVVIYMDPLAFMYPQALGLLNICLQYMYLLENVKSLLHLPLQPTVAPCPI